MPTSGKKRRDRPTLVGVHAHAGRAEPARRSGQGDGKLLGAQGTAAHLHTCTAAHLHTHTPAPCTPTQLHAHTPADLHSRTPARLHTAHLVLHTAVHPHTCTTGGLSQTKLLTPRSSLPPQPGAASDHPPRQAGFPGLPAARTQEGGPLEREQAQTPGAQTTS